jgi:hypothetical protein
MDPDRTVSWMAIQKNHPVVDKSGTEIGEAEKVLGDEGDDIFHGVHLNLKGWGGHVELPADRITRITPARIYTDLGPKEGESLKPLK